MTISEHERTNIFSNKDPLDEIQLNDIKGRIVKNFLDIIILAELNNQKSGLSGYDFMMVVHRKFGTLISSGTVYSSLYAINRKGWVKGIPNGRKTTFVLTDEGREVLHSIARSRKELAKFMKDLFESS